jgi:hypothetical protein
MPAIQQQQGDGTTEDPTDALQKMLAGQYTPPAPQTQPGGFPSSAMRNPAITGALSQKYGLGPDTGATSQTDLESLDQFMRSGALSDKIAASVAPEQVKGQYGMAEAGLKEQAATEREGMKGASAANVAGIQNIGKIAPAQIKAGTEFGATGGSTTQGPDAVQYWASQAMRDSNVLTKLPASMKQAVAMQMAQSGGDVNTMTNQTRQMSEAANDLLPLIDNVQNKARALQSQGLFDVVRSPVRQFLVSHGMGTLLGHGENAAAETGQFQTDLGLLQSGVARAHAGARGAGNTGMIERFEKLMNASGDLPTFLGELNGVKDLLSVYAKHTNPSGAGGASDPYADPNYQPR